MYVGNSNLIRRDYIIYLQMNEIYSYGRNEKFKYQICTKLKIVPSEKNSDKMAPHLWVQLHLQNKRRNFFSR
jgi:hypothetical protein